MFKAKTLLYCVLLPLTTGTISRDWWPFTHSLVFHLCISPKGERPGTIMISLFTRQRVSSIKYLPNIVSAAFKRIVISCPLSDVPVMAEPCGIGGQAKTGLNLKEEGPEKVLFRFGLLTDVQYANVDDRLNFEGSTMRYYRNAVKLLEEAVKFWKKDEPAFVLQLGDIVEGNHVEKKDRDSTLQVALDPLKQLSCYVCHLWGNHEFYLFSRRELAMSLLNSKVKTVSNNCSVENEAVLAGNASGLENGGTRMSSLNGLEKGQVLINNIPHTYDRSQDSGRKYYFSFCPHPKFKFVALDSYDISICGREEDDLECEEAKKILSVKNTNKNWNSPFGLTEPHFVKFNGGVSKEQLQWLREELQDADKNGQNVIILSHIPLHPESTIFLCNIWNYQDLLDVIWKHNCVRACLCGHSHEDGSFIDHKGIHHIVFPAVLECSENENAFADVHVLENKLKIFGKGKVKSCVLDFKI